MCSLLLIILTFLFISGCHSNKGQWIWRLLPKTRATNGNIWNGLGKTISYSGTANYRKFMGKAVSLIQVCCIQRQSQNTRKQYFPSCAHIPLNLQINRTRCYRFNLHCWPIAGVYSPGWIHLFLYIFLSVICPESPTVTSESYFQAILRPRMEPTVHDLVVDACKGNLHRQNLSTVRQDCLLLCHHFML